MENEKIKEGETVKHLGQTYTAEYVHYPERKLMLRIHNDKPAEGIRQTHVDINILNL